MTSALEKIITLAWNMLATDPSQVAGEGIGIGRRVIDDRVTSAPFRIERNLLSQHLAILGVTGSGKTTLLKVIIEKLIREKAPWTFFDLHGDTIPDLLSRLAQHEQRSGQDVSQRTIVIDSDPRSSVGVNFLEPQPGQELFVQIAEITAIFKRRWPDTSGARTEELLRNSLYSLAASGMTLVEIQLFLTNEAFRSRCLQQVNNPEILNYFRYRYDAASEGMQTTMRDPILNRFSAFTVDPRFRYLVGQTKSTFDFRQALDAGFNILINLEKAKLGEQAAVLGSLFLTKLKNAIFSRRSRFLYTVFADELQNLLAYDADLETLLSESRKFGISIISGSQYLDRFSPEMKAALSAVGSHIYFRLSSQDADRVASALDGGRSMAHQLKNLPNRQLIAKCGSDPWARVQVANSFPARTDFADLYARCQRRWTRTREEIETEIQQRQAAHSPERSEVLDGWE